MNQIFFYESICKAEGLYKNSESVISINLSCLESILKDLKNYKGLISVQCKNQIDKCTFYMGKIKEVRKNEVQFLCVETNGKWENSTTIIPFREITQISFGDNYSKKFYKYM